MQVRITVNGGVRTVSDVDPDERLLMVLRERLGHVEVKDGCSPQGQCGSCTVWLEGKPRAACVVRAEQANNRSVITPAGLPQALGCALAGAFSACGAVQCGFCSGGIAMRLAALLRDTPAPSDQDVERALRFHVCRCVGPEQLRQAGVRAGEVLAGRREPDPAPEMSPLLGAYPYLDDIPVEGAWHLAPILAPGPGELTQPLRAPAGCELVALTDRAAHDGVILGLLAAPERRMVRRAVAALAIDWRTRDLPAEDHDLVLAPAHPGFLETEAVSVEGERVITTCERPADVPAPRVRYTPGGGGFGGRNVPWLEEVVIAAAQRLERPVRIALTREESQRAGPTRHGARGEVELVGDCLHGELTYVAGERSLCAPEVLAMARWCLPGPYQLESAVRVAIEETGGPPSGWMRGEGALAAVTLRERAIGPGIERRLRLLDPRSRVAGCLRELGDWLDGREPQGVALHVGMLPDAPGLWARVEGTTIVHPYEPTQSWQLESQHATGELGPCRSGSGWPFVLISVAHGAQPGGAGPAVAAAALSDNQQALREVRLVIDTGRLHKPRNAESHARGGVQMGLGAALSEQVVRRAGVTHTRTLRSLGIRSTTTPAVLIRFVGDGPPLAGVAEACVAPVAAAVAQALGQTQLPSR